VGEITPVAHLTHDDFVSRACWSCRQHLLFANPCAGCLIAGVGDRERNNREDEKQITEEQSHGN